MINLRIRTEYSFSSCYGPLNKVIAAVGDAHSIGITDRHGTWGHVAFEKACRKAKKMPIFGVELAVVPELIQERQPVNWMAFLARNNDGLQELYELVSESTLKENFYIHQRIPYNRVRAVSNNIIILSGNNPQWDKLNPKQKNLFVELSPTSSSAAIAWSRASKRPLVATSDNYYPTMEHKSVYEIIAGRNRDSRTTPMHILDAWEWRSYYPNHEAAINMTRLLAAECNATIPKAQMVKFNSPYTLEEMCIAAAPKRKIDLKDPIYAARLRRELDLIADKDFADYFFVIADMLRFAKQHMLVGPARGSSSGSLVCYLLSITEIDPIPFDLIFERFIDVNRKDLPDIDIDFPDDRRDMVFDYIKNKYGEPCVARLGTIMRYQAKSAIDAVAISLRIPIPEVENLKGAIIDRSGGDARAAFCILDTFNELEVGKAMLLKYPHLRIAAEIEAHAKTTGQHAAGIVITQEPISKFCSMNQRTGAVMVDKYDAESVNLLKIDALGLRTLSVIQDCLDQIGRSREWLMEQPLEDEDAFDVINNKRFAGIFQFEGYALQSLCQQMKIEHFEDIASLGALGRPGPITSGGATEFVKRRTGTAPVTYLHPLCAEITKVTYGIVIYQEQVMNIARTVGRLSWEDVSSLRKAMSKSLGKEFFDQYWVRFLEGAKDQAVPEVDARRVWDAINSMGCLSGDTLIKNPYPNHVTPAYITIRELASNGGYIRPHSTYASESSAGQKRSYSGKRTGPPSQSGEKYDIVKKQQVYSQQEDGRLRPRRLIDCWYSGIKMTYEVRVESGATIRTTLDHRFKRSTGIYSRLEQLAVGDEVLLMGKPPKGSKHKPYNGTGSGAHNKRHSKNYVEQKKHLHSIHKHCTRCKVKPYQETHHIDGDRSNNDLRNLKPVCRSCHKQIHINMDGLLTIPHTKGKAARIEKIVFIGNPKMEETYDMEMPDKNFVANDFIVHNSWSFNRSHAIAYGMVTYWCMLLKAHYPLEWATACLRNARDEEQCISLLRELESEGFKYVDFDPKLSIKNWSVQNGLLVGGLLNVKGIGPKKADDIMARRAAGKELTPAVQKMLDGASTPYQYEKVFECRVRFADIIANPMKYNIRSKIWNLIDITADMEGEFVFFGKIVKINLRDLNEPIHVAKRGGVYLEGQTLYLICTVEDNTSSIYVAVNQKNYLELGKPIVEAGRVGDWFLWKGYLRRGFRKVYVQRCIPEAIFSVPK